MFKQFREKMKKHLHSQNYLRGNDVLLETHNYKIIVNNWYSKQKRMDVCLVERIDNVPYFSISSAIEITKENLEQLEYHINNLFKTNNSRNIIDFMNSLRIF